MDIDEINAVIKNMSQENEQLRANVNNNQQIQATSSVNTYANDQNLIEWQLSLDEILADIERLLRGQVMKTIRDKQGNERRCWVDPEDKNKQVFNEYGVQEILRTLKMYLNRNTILSNYDEETIRTKVLDFGTELADIIMLKYHEMGMDTSDKYKLYPIIVLSIVDNIHSAYLRALNGGERESLRTARTVHQNENQQQPTDYSRVMPRQKSIWKPTTWGR